MMRAPAPAVATQMQTSETLQREPEEQEERKPATQQKKNTKLSSKTTAKLSTSSTKRIQKELAEITLDPPPNCTAGPKGDNIYEWKSTILGPPGSVYEAGAFFLDITFSSDYPFRPPKVTFHTRIYHCNITSQGTIRRDALKDNCSPALTISKVFLSICSLLTDCNAADPLVGSIDTQYLTNTAEHDRVTRRDQETRNIIHVICMQREGAEVSSHCAAIFTAVTTWTSVYVMLILLLPLSSGDSP